MSPTTRTQDRDVSSEEIYLARWDNADDLLLWGDNSEDYILVSGGTSRTARTSPSTSRTAIPSI